MLISYGKNDGASPVRDGLLAITLCVTICISVLLVVCGIVMYQHMPMPIHNVPIQLNLV